MLRLSGTSGGHPVTMSESSVQHANPSWPHPESEAARLDGHFAPVVRPRGVPSVDDAVHAARD